MPGEQNLLRLTWTQAAWADYEYWQGQDKKTLKRINALHRKCSTGGYRLPLSLSIKIAE